MKIHPKQLEQMAKKMGMKTEEIEAEEVIIKGPTTYVIRNPHVAKVHIMGQESIQITGELEEQVAEEDVQTVMDQTGVTKAEAAQALEETGDLAEAILKLKNSS